MSFTVVDIPEFPVWAARSLDPELKRTELLVVAGGRVAARSEGLVQRGIEEGWPVERARALAPEAAVRPLVGAEVRLVWEDTLDALNQRTPWVEPQRPGRACVRFATRPEAEDAARALPARLGMAADRSTALLAALDAHEGQVCVVVPGAEAEFRRDLPTDILAEAGVGEATLERLSWLGFPTVGSLARLTRAQLCAQFEEGALLDTLVRCEDRRPVPLYVPPAVVSADHAFETPAVEPAEYEPVLRHLVEEAAGGLGGRRATFLTVRAEGGGAQHTSRRLLQTAVAEAERLWNPARLTLKKALGTHRREIERLTLILGGLLAPRRAQGRLFPTRPGPEAALRAVEARFPGRLLRITRLDPWSLLPEEAATLEPVRDLPPPAEEP